MITGTISGQIIDKMKLEPTETAPFCAMIVVQVRTWVTGREVTQEVECYCPKWMSKRLEYYFNNDVKRITVSYDHIAVARTVDQNKRTCLCVNVNQVY